MSVGIEYSKFIEVLKKIESTKKRLEIQDTLNKYFKELDEKSLIYSCHLLTNTIAESYKGIELGIGDSIIIKAVCQMFGVSKDTVESEYKKIGDLGSYVEIIKAKHKTLSKITQKLTLEQVFNSLLQISQEKGTGSQDKKIEIIMKLFISSTYEEIKYIVRSLQAKLRIGVSDKTILVALSKTFETDDSNEDSEEIIKTAFSETPSYSKLVKNLFSGGLKSLVDNGPSPGIPIKPMLANPTKSSKEILDRFSNNFTCEYKYDGERSQIHLKDSEYHIFSRNSIETTDKFPDAIEIMKKVTKNTSYIIDCEIVAVDENGVILPFQTLSTRSKKNVSIEDIKVNIQIVVFDILYVGGVSVMNKNLVKRRKLLFSSFKEIENKFIFAKFEDFEEFDDDLLMSVMNKAINGSCEGLIVKDLSSLYEPGKRSSSWLKFKKDYLNTIGDTLDLIPIGGIYGKGKRSGVFGAFIVAVYDQNNDEFQSVSKIGTGFTEEQLKNLHEKLMGISESTKPENVLCEIKADVWFSPILVWEVATADFTLSPIYFGGPYKDKGIALRFPRFIKERTDKNINDATTSDEIIEFYKKQFSKE